MAYHTVYKALDRPSSLFGLKGSYVRYAGFGIAGGVMVGIIIGMFAPGLVATIVALVLAAASYFVVLRIQDKFSERERVKYLCSRRLPRYIRVPAVPFRRLLLFTREGGRNGGPRS